MEQAIRNFGISDTKILSRYKHAFRGFAAELAGEQFKRLKKSPIVKLVEQNRRFKAVRFNPETAASQQKTKGDPYLFNSTQTIPWGVERVNGPLDGVGKKAWIIGTGIDLDHPDLNVDLANAASFIGGQSANDLNGVGTFMAGIIAAKDNSYDVAGVAAGASVVPVKVLDAVGSGTSNDIVDGIDYVAGRASLSDIVTFTATTGKVNGTTSVDVAVTNAANAGIRFVIAAGDRAKPAQNYSPPHVDHSNVWTISAYDIYNYWASFSNYGNPPIDYSGPGVDITSTSKSGGVIAGFSSTAYATAHIAGLLLVAPGNLAVDGQVINDPDGNADPILVYLIPLTVKISGPEYMNEGQTATFTANVTGGTPPYGYAWSIKTGPLDPTWEVIRNATSSTYNHTAGSTSTEILKVSVADVNLQTAQAQHKITITQFN